MKGLNKSSIDLNALKRQLRDGWLPIPQTVIPPQRDENFLWTAFPHPKFSSKTLLEIIRDSVANGLKNVDDRVGIWLSGGIDSSTILYLLCDLLGSDNVVAFHLDCGYQDEVERAKLVADFFEVKLVMDSFTIADHLSLLPDAVLYLRTPTDLTTQNLRIARMCLKNGIKTAFSGMGLDEIQGGYIEHIRATNENEFKQVEARLLERGRSHMAWFMSTLARGLELKHPYLDPNVVSYARYLPRSSKCRGTETKILIRELMKNKMPIDIVEAGRRVLSKRGFLPLIEEWWDEGLGKWVEEMIPLVPEYIEKPKAGSLYREKVKAALLNPKLLYSYLQKTLSRKVYTSYWMKHRLATVPIFLDHLDSGRYNFSD